MKEDNYFLEDTYNYRKSISDLMGDYKKLEDDYKKILTEKKYLEREFQKILNSRGWKFLEKLRKIKKSSHNNISDKVVINSIKEENTHTKSDYFYNSHYENNIDFSAKKYKTDIKALAFYLPQYHTFKENNKWWGEGFTEWTNTKKAKPRFNGHYLPREPHDDIGYYTLDKSVIKEQVKLAKQHGIYGFCFYYYWFSGKRLMEKPVDIFLKNKEIDFPFCLCWANENWTRRWDGAEQDILIGQKYSKNDPENFIKDIKKYLVDPRYIRINDKPVILIYKPEDIPDLSSVIQKWRETARKEKIGEILIWTRGFIQIKNIQLLDHIDAEFDFAPHPYVHSQFLISHSKQNDIYSYKKIVKYLLDSNLYKNHFPLKPFYYSCTLGWDNSARRKDSCVTFAEYSPEYFYYWLKLIIDETRKTYDANNRFIFVNAWNEWGEGTYLEPDKKYGYTNINTLSKALYDMPYDNSVLLFDKNITGYKKITGKIAVQIHIYYIDLADELFEYLENIPFEFDLYISTTDKNNIEKIKNIVKKYDIKYGKIKIEVVENIGRDIYPFLKQISGIYKNYDYIGHFHTKKSLHSDFGDSWRIYLYTQLLGSKQYIQNIFSVLKKKNVGIMFPENFWVVEARFGSGLGANEKIMNLLLEKMRLDFVSNQKKYLFPIGSMFWAATDGLSKLFDLNLSQKDFQKENGQLDGTTAHAIERLFGVLPQKMGLSVIKFLNKN